MTYPARCADTPPHAEGNSNYNGRAMSAEDIERTVAAEAPMAKAGRGRGLTWRAAIIGGLLVVFISIWSQYAELVIHGTQISLTYPPIGAFLVFFALILVVQWPLQVWGKVRGGQARRLPHAEEGNDGYGQAGPLPHAEKGNDGYGQAGPLPHAEEGNDGYGQAGPLPHAEEGNDGHGQAGPLPHAEERNDGYGQAGPLPHAEEGNDGYGQAGPLPHAAGRGYALSARELVIIWSMLSLAIGVASIDIAQKMPPMIAGPIYYASEENHYEDLFLPHVAKWLQPQDAAAVQGMFEGSAQPVPWDVWLLPLVLWSLFFVVAYWVMLCGVALFQRQWVAHERLLFPLVQVPLQVIEAPEPGRAFNAFFRNKLVWLGIALGALPHLYTGLHDYFPTIPQADVFLWGKRVFQGGLGRPWTPLSNLLIGILPLIIGLSFLLTREISFSLWAFYLLGKAEAIFGAALGIDGLRTATGTDPFPFPGLQTAGAYIGLAAVSVWVARKGLWEAIRRPVGGQARRLPHANSSHADGMQARRWPHADGLQAGMPRGVVVYGGGIGFVALIVFCVAAGMPVRAALVVMGASFVYLLAMTRLVAEGGMPWCAEPDFRGHNLMLALFPGGSLRMPQIVAGGMMLTFSHDLRVAPMPRFMQSFKMTAETGTRNRDLVAALGLTLAIALPVSVWALIKDAYLHGGIAINPYRFVTLARAPGLFMEKATTTAHPHVDLPSLAIIGYGAGKLLLLNALRTYYLWWPLHPVGYAMSFVVYLHKEWFSVLIGWAVQTLIIRYGGHKGYQTARPLFLGLILGAMIAGGFWLVLDGFTGLRDHKILY